LNSKILKLVPPRKHECVFPNSDMVGPTFHSDNHFLLLFVWSLSRWLFNWDASANDQKSKDLDNISLGTSSGTITILSVVCIFGS